MNGRTDLWTLAVIFGLAGVRLVGAVLVAAGVLLTRWKHTPAPLEEEDAPAKRGGLSRLTGGKFADKKKAAPAEETV